MSEQLYLFQDSKEEILLREIELLKKKQENVRKSLYARNGELHKMLDETRHELEMLKLAMIRGNSWIQ
jgi:hypothetical protein